MPPVTTTGKDPPGRVALGPQRQVADHQQPGEIAARDRQVEQRGDHDQRHDADEDGVGAASNLVDQSGDKPGGVELVLHEHRGPHGDRQHQQRQVPAPVPGPPPTQPSYDEHHDQRAGQHHDRIDGRQHHLGGKPRVAEGGRPKVEVDQLSRKVGLPHPNRFCRHVRRSRQGALASALQPVYFHRGRDLECIQSGSTIAGWNQGDSRAMSGSPTLPDEIQTTIPGFTEVRPGHRRGTRDPAMSRRPCRRRPTGCRPVGPESRASATSRNHLPRATGWRTCRIRNRMFLRRRRCPGCPGPPRSGHLNALEPTARCREPLPDRRVKRGPRTTAGLAGLWRPHRRGPPETRRRRP